MKKQIFLLVVAMCMILMLAANLFAQADKEVNKVFEPKEKIKIKLALGSCELQKSSDGKIHVRLVYSYNDDNFTPVFNEKGSSLILEEKFNGHNHNDGHSEWTVSVPDKSEIELNTGTGNLSIKGITVEMKGNTGTGDIELTEVKGELDLNTGTGSIEMENCDGEFDVNSGTGNLNIKDSKGTFDANSGTGDVEVNTITIVDEGEFNSGTGDVEITKPLGENYDLNINSGTGDAVLKMAGTPIEGYFEFTANARKGKISSPVKFDKEDEVKDDDNHYVRKSFTKGKGTPRFYISTGTGRAELQQ